LDHYFAQESLGIFMNKKQKYQKGFVLIVSLIMLVAVTLFVMAGMRSSTVSERMAGSHMDRGRAKMAAEQALVQGLAALKTGGTICVEDGCTTANLATTGAAVTTTDMPSVWSETNAVAVTIASGQLTSAKFLINWLNNSAFTTSTPSTGKEACKAYSIMGRGVGLASTSVVVLQTIAYACPTE
jgi:type IV pilus assembly protein PilX